MTRILWLAHYRCGCIEEARRKKDLVGYCGIHGECLLEPLVRLPEGATVAEGLCETEEVCQ